MISKNERRFYWFCLALTIYIVIGFKLVPSVIHDQMVQNLDKTLTEKTTIKKVEFNPFTLTAKIHDFKLGDVKKPLVSFEEFELDFGLLQSIFELHVNVEEVRLKGMFLDVIQEKDDSINLAKLVKPTNEPKKEEKPSEPSNIKFLVSKVLLQDANINFKKIKEDEPFKLSLKNINYSLYDLGTYKNALSSNTFTLDINEQSKLGVYGAFNLQPFKMYGKANITNLKLEELISYKKEMLNFDLDKNATFDLALDYDVNTTKDLEVLLDSTKLEFKNINLSQKDSQPVKLERLAIEKFKLDLAKQNISLNGINLDKPSLSLVQNKDGLNLVKLVNTSKTEAEKKEEPKKETTTSKPWNIDVNNLSVNNTNLLFNDQVAKTIISNKDFSVKLSSLNLLGSHIKLNGLNIKNPNLSLKDSKNKLAVDSKNLNINLDKLNIKDNIVSISKINVDKNKIVINDRKSAMRITTNKTKVTVSDLQVNDGKTSIKEVKNSIGSLYLSNYKTKTDIKGLNTAVKVKDLVLGKGVTSISDISVYSPKLSINDKTNKTTIDISKTNVNINSLVQNKTNLLINKIKIAKPSIKLVNKKNFNVINAKDIEVTLNKLSQNSKDLKIASVKVYEPNLDVYNTKEKTLIKADNLNLNILGLVNNPNRLKIKSTNLNKPQITVILPKKDAKKAKEEKKVVKGERRRLKSKEAALDIGPVNINNAVLVFQDKNLPLPFKTTVTELNGKISEFKTSQASKTRLEVKGIVDKYGTTKITGIVDPNDVKILTDITMLFKNISMKNFTPYTEKFIGRQLDSGKLDLDLKYNIRKSDLDATNNIIVTKIKLGKEVKSPDAVSLPLGLAIALLEDSNGVIDLNIPVSGNIDDPKFSVGPIVWKAFSNLIMKAITAPFSLLGALFGFDENEIKSVNFDFAKSKVEPAQKETLDKISKILSKRPNLALKLVPSYHGQKDLKAMKKAKVDKLIETKIPNNQIRNYESKYQEVLEDEYKKLDKTHAKKKQTFIKDKKLDSKAYTKFLHDKVIASQKVTKTDLEMMAKDRITNIKTYLVKEKLIKTKQVQISSDVKVHQDNNKTSNIDLEISKAN